MISRMRSMIVAYDLNIFILDPIQQALPDLSNDAVKELMDKLLKLAKQTGVSLVLVSHMRKPPNDKPHDVSEYDLLGSSAINQVSFNTILLSRDKMGSTDEIKSSTKLQMVKCRRTGQTGEAGWLYYNPNTGRLEEGEDPYVALDDFGG
jgi:twinkle protein